METLGSNPSSECGGNEERFGEVVDPGLLLQSSKDQRVWVEGLGDLVILELAIMVVLNAGRATCPKVGEGYKYPSLKNWSLEKKSDRRGTTGPHAVVPGCVDSALFFAIADYPQR